MTRPIENANRTITERKQRMKPKKRRNTFAAAVLVLTLAAAGCSAASSDADLAAPESGFAAAVETEASSDGAASSTSSENSSSEEAEIATTENQESHATANDLDYEESAAVEISLLGDTATSDSGDVMIEGSTVSITSEGVYSLSGRLTDGGVVVDAADADDVILLLNGVDITNSGGAAIAVTGADEAIVILMDGTTNSLTDGTTYVFPDADTDEPNATLYSAADLTIAGTGGLIIDANYNDGITSKDGLVIESGAISVDAVDDGIRGKDYVIINGGDIDVVAGGDGIKADNDEDAERGYILISAGIIEVASGDDGVQAATDALITGGDLTISAGIADSTEYVGRAIQGDVMVVITGGTIVAEATDDAIHSNDSITIDGGDLTLASDDDGIHGDFFVTINDGSITITKSFEGIESENIEINDGFIDITSSEDGLNVADASTTAAATEAPGGPGGGPGGGVESAGDFYVTINGGTTVITITGDLDEQGDGIDSNGHVTMTGGLVAISGPTDTRNSALDYNGTFEVSGGLLIGTNVDGRNSEGVGTGSSQASLYVTSGSVIDAGSLIHIQTIEGDGLVTFEAVNEFSVIVFTSPDLVDGEDYEIYLGGSVSGESTAGLYDDGDYTPGALAGPDTARL
jgi:hypothetical protein